MFRQQLSNLSRLTSSTLKYATSSTAGYLPQWSSQNPGSPSQQQIDFWIENTERGLDALLNDEFDVADVIFMQYADESPFHAVGYALMAYVEAMLGLDSEKIQTAATRIAKAEELTRQLSRQVKRRDWQRYSSRSSSSSSSNVDPVPDLFEKPQPKHPQSSTYDHSIAISFTSTRDQEPPRHPLADNDSASSTSSAESVMTAPEEQPTENEEADPSILLDKESSHPPLYGCDRAPKGGHTIDLQCELLEVCCMLMGATIQFLRNSWIEYMKAAYKLRKAYKLYEQLFEALTTQKPTDYAATLRQQRKRKPYPIDRQQSGVSVNTTTTNSSSCSWNGEAVSTLLSSTGATAPRSTWSEKRFSLFSLPTGRRQSTDTRRRSLATQPPPIKCDSTVESGVFFGIGLFSLIFSLLPPKVNKILNTLGFHSSRPFALHILQRSYDSQGLFSSLSALTLLVYYTNLSLFIHPQLLPSSMSLENARRMLDKMKLRYPNSKIWELLEGKLCKMEGKARKGVEILRDSRRRHSVRLDPGTGGTAVHGTGQKRNLMLSDLAQLQALAVYEMGWGQIFLGDYFQASETFFRLESMNNWSRAFYHYIATCCMFADEQYDKAGMEFHQIPGILDRKRQLGGRLLPNEVFVDRKIKRWRERAQKLTAESKHHPTPHPWMTAQQRQQQQMIKERYSLLDGDVLKEVITVNPLWELIYLWNGVAQLTKPMLHCMEQQLRVSVKLPAQQPSDRAIAHVLLGAALRELGNYDEAATCFRHAVELDSQVQDDRWVVPYAMYEMATLYCFKVKQNEDEAHLLSEARKWTRRSQQYFHQRRNSTHTTTTTHNTNTTSSTASTSSTSADEDDDPNTPPPPPTDSGEYYDWESRLHIRCQLLLEKLDELSEM